MSNFRATFAHIKTQIGTKIKIWLATMFGEAVVYLSDWTDKPLTDKPQKNIFVTICVLMFANVARKFNISQELIEIWMRRKIKNRQSRT